MFLEFIHRLIFPETQRFGNLFLFSRKITGAPNLLGRLETASLITGSSH
jgi:hypothetical protein